MLNKFNQTPLHIAVMKNKCTINLLILLISEISVKAKDLFGRTPLHYAAKRDTA